MLFLVAPLTQRLQIKQVIGLGEIGETVNRFDVVRFRGLSRDSAPALTASVAIAKERQRLEIHATGALPIFVLPNFGFPVDIIEVATSTGVVRLWRFLPPRHLHILGAFQHVASANVEIVTTTVLSNALSGRYVVSATQGFDTNPVSVKVQRIGGTTEVMSDPIVIGPSGNDR